MLCQGYKFGKKASIAFSTAVAALTVTTSCYNFYYFFILENGIIVSKQRIWLNFEELAFSYSVLFDGISCFMIFIISLISSGIILYSSWYMDHDSDITKFQAILFFFAFSMNFMVTSGNFIQFFIGWECIGLASFLLISHWSNRNDAINGGLKAVVYNRLGDIFFFLALCLIYITFKTFDFQEIMTMTQLMQIEIQERNNLVTNYFLGLYDLEAITLFLVLAAFVKSAMILFHGWLFNAMEGPTPVSALLHSATMVTAGVFLLLRVSFLLENNPYTSFVFIIIGLLTAISTAIGSYFQADLKRIVAYSTCSQLGLMVSTIGFSCFSQTMYHLVTHAFFKAMLFVIAGIVIHLLLDHQDIRTGSKAFLSLSSSEILAGCFVASCALFGYPTFSGFFSKDSFWNLF